MLRARKSDIHHKVEMGILFDTYYDTETTDLDKRFAEITQFGGVICDLAGNILHRVDLRAKISPYTVISPFAWLVQRLRLEDLKKGEPRAIFMGRVKRFFEYSNQLYRAPFAANFLELCRKGTYKNPEGKEEGYYSYPVENDDGTTDWDYIRIHENLKKFHFKSGDGKWQKRDIKSLSIGYNNINADDQWLWTQGFMAGLENIFITHLPKNGQYRLDALRVVEALYCLGGGGENGLKIPFQDKDKPGSRVPVLSLGRVLAENTRDQSDMRGISEGIELEDGSHVDLSQLHGALQDALALRGLMLFLRKNHSCHVAQMERNTDWKYVVDKMTEVRGSFGVSPPLAYVDKTYPAIDGKMVALIGTDQYRNAPKVAVVWNLNVDPKTYSYNGRNIGELTEQEWQKIFEDSRSNPNAPLKVLKVHKSVRLFSAEDGYAAGFNQGMDRQEIYARIVALKKSRSQDKIMRALRLANPRIFGADRLIVPQLEEELFTFSTLELFDNETGEDVQIHTRVHDRVEMVAQKSRSHIMKIKLLWLRAIQFDEDIFLEGSGAEKMLEKVKSLNKELKKLESPLLPEPDRVVDSPQTALAYKVKILFFARTYFEQEALQDIGHHFWFEDKDGIRYADKDVRSWSQDRVDEAFGTGRLSIVHERVNTTALVIDRIIEELGATSRLGPEVNAQLAAFKALRQQGMPHYKGQSCRWYTLANAHRDIAKIEQNEVSNSDFTALEAVLPGLWSEKMTDHHDSVAALNEYKSYLKALEDKPISPEMMPYIGLNKATGYPIKRSEFALSPENWIVLNVPDRYIESPSVDTTTGRPIWVLPLSVAFQDAANGNKNLIFRASETGRIYHLPTARIVPVPPNAGAFREFYNQVAKAYEASGSEFMKDRSHMALIGNGPYPVHNLRAMSEGAQTLHVEKDSFEGLLSHRLAGFRAPMSGIILRDDNLRLTTGCVRIQEVDKMRITGWEFETEIKFIRAVSMEDVFNFSAEDISRYGFGTKDEAIDSFCALFTRQKRDPRQSKNKAWAIALGNIAPDDPDRGVMYFKPDERIFSRCTLNKER